MKEVESMIEHIICNNHSPKEFELLCEELFEMAEEHNVDLSKLLPSPQHVS